MALKILHECCFMQFLSWFAVAQAQSTPSSDTVKLRPTQGLNDSARMLLL